MSVIPYAARAGMQALRYVPRIVQGSQGMSRALRYADIAGRGARKVVQYAPVAIEGYKQVKKATQGARKVAPQKKQMQSKAQAKQMQAAVAATTQQKLKYSSLPSTAGGFIQAGPKPLQYDKQYNNKGSIKINEYGGTITSGSLHSVYLHHGIASEQVVQSAFRAITKELCRQSGLDILNWSDIIPYSQFAGPTGSIRVDMTYLDNPAANTSGSLSTLEYGPNMTSGSFTFESLSNGMLDYWRTFLAANDQPRELQAVHLIHIVRDLAGTGLSIIPRASIQMKQVKFDIKVDSTLTVQNRTLAEVSSAGEAAAERDNLLDIENVPLQGRVYSRANSWRNYLDVENRTQSAYANTSNVYNKKLVCDETTGLCQFESSANAPSSLQTPPRGYVLGYNSDAKITLNPGNVHANHMSFKCQISAAKLFVYFSYLLGNAVNNVSKSQRVQFGHVSGIGLEKILDSSRSSGSPIAVGYQLKQKYCCALVYKKRVASNPINNITSTPISYETDEPAVPSP